MNPLYPLGTKNMAGDFKDLPQKEGGEKRGGEGRGQEKNKGKKAERKRVKKKAPKYENYKIKIHACH